MNKTEKKIEKAIRVALTDVCNQALEEVPGFKWITHFVNYDDFTNSLIVVCVFGTIKDLSSALYNHHDDFLRALIASKLSVVNIQCKDSQKYVRFDSDETWEIRRYRLH